MCPILTPSSPQTQFVLVSIQRAQSNIHMSIVSHLVWHKPEKVTTDFAIMVIFGEIYVHTFSAKNSSKIFKKLKKNCTNKYPQNKFNSHSPFEQKKNSWTLTSPYYLFFSFPACVLNHSLSSFEQIFQASISNLNSHFVKMLISVFQTSPNIYIKTNNFFKKKVFLWALLQIILEKHFLAYLRIWARLWTGIHPIREA